MLQAHLQAYQCALSLICTEHICKTVTKWMITCINVDMHVLSLTTSQDNSFFVFPLGLAFLQGHVLDESGHCLPVFKMILVTQQVWVLLIYFLTISWWGNHIWRHNLCLCGHHHSLLQLCILQPECLTNYTIVQASTLLHSFIYVCVCVCVCM
jgi:hypothetical protein